MICLTSHPVVVYNFTHGSGRFIFGVSVVALIALSDRRWYHLYHLQFCWLAFVAHPKLAAPLPLRRECGKHKSKEEKTPSTFHSTIYTPSKLFSESITFRTRIVTLRYIPIEWGNILIAMASCLLCVHSIFLRILMHFVLTSSLLYKIRKRLCKFCLEFKLEHLVARERMRTKSHFRCGHLLSPWSVIFFLRSKLNILNEYT